MKKMTRRLAIILPLVLAIGFAPLAGAVASETTEVDTEEEKKRHIHRPVGATQGRSQLEIEEIVFTDTLEGGAAAQAAQGQETPAESLTIHSQDYLMYGSVLHSHLYQDANGNYVRVEPEYIFPSNIGNEHSATNWIEGEEDADLICVEYYDKDFKLAKSMTVEYELPIFAGFFAGEKYNFLIYGQENPDEDDQKEVYRVVKYSKDWKRLGSASILGANTVTPCDHGSLRMVEHDWTLYIRTCHTMYTSKDGLNHQSSMAFSGNEEDMVTTELDATVGHRAAYDSHSFDQYIIIDGEGRLVTLDHADAYPRSFLLSRSEDHVKELPYSKSAESVPLMTFEGKRGDNHTGASLGGLEESATHYLAVGNAVLEDADFAKRTVRNAKLFVVDKNNFTTSGVKTVELSHFPDSGKNSETTPQIVKISDDRFLVLWENLEEKDKAGWKEWTTLSYVFVNGKGETIGETRTVEGALSDCQPIYDGTSVVWYATGTYDKIYTDEIARYDMVGAKPGAPVFYAVNAQTGELSITPAGTGGTLSTEPLKKPADASGETRDSSGSGETVRPGDFDGNGKVNNRDLAQFLQLLAGKAVTPADEKAMDLNGDGSRNNKDLALLLQALAGKDVGVRIG